MTSAETSELHAHVLNTLRQRGLDPQQDEITGSWSASCPLCSTHTKLYVGSDEPGRGWAWMLVRCLNGHDYMAVLDALGYPATQQVLAADIRDAVNRLTVQAEARRIHAEQEARKHPQPPPDAGTLAEVLARPVTARWRVEGLLPAGGRMLLSAQRKTGKTTLVGGLARALLTGEDFLGRFGVDKLTGRVVILNYEVTGSQIARWLDDIGVPRDRAYLVNLRGCRNPLADEQGRGELAELIRRQDGEALIVDPFGRAYTGKSQNDAAEVTPWLVRLDEVAAAAGVGEVILTAHAGWNGERTRGSSALEDWPDVFATMTRDEDSDARFIRAEGRDVDIEEDRLDYDPISRRLTLSGDGSRAKVRKVAHLEELAEAVRDIVRETPGVNVGGIGATLRERDEPFRKGDENKAAALAEERGWIRRERGKNNAWTHFPPVVAPVAPSSPAVAPGVPKQSPRSPCKTGGDGWATEQAEQAEREGELPQPNPGSTTTVVQCSTCHDAIADPGTELCWKCSR